LRLVSVYHRQKLLKEYSGPRWGYYALNRSLA